jgi:hypothetical protein
MSVKFSTETDYSDDEIMFCGCPRGSSCDCDDETVKCCCLAAFILLG